jgi:CPA1 family monovalent cation:H+ antiporter
MLEAALLLGLTAAFAYLNHYALGLPHNTGLLAIAFASALLVIAVEALVPELGLGAIAAGFLDRLDLPHVLLGGVLAFLLFSAAFGIDVHELLRRKWTVLALATVGVALSTVLMAGASWLAFRAVGIGRLAFRAVGIGMPLSWCLVFGALISPTDPVTVVDVLSRNRTPLGLQTVIAGESLFNDGMAIALYSLLLRAATGDETAANPLHIAIDFVREAGGAALLGLAIGAIAYLAKRGIDEENIELMISLAAVTGTYAVAGVLGLSAPIAVALVGLILGSLAARHARSERTRDYLSKFWSLVDQILNSMLFLLIGLELAALRFGLRELAAGLLVVPLALLVRFVAVALPSLPLNIEAPHKARSLTLLTWAGLRGGVSVALALALPDSPEKPALVAATYAVVLFTMLVQGPSLGFLLRRVYAAERGGA